MIRPNPISTVNIAAGRGISVRDLATDIAQRLERQDLLSFAPDDTPLNEPMHVIGDATRLRGLGFTPEYWPATPLQP